MSTPALRALGSFITLAACFAVATAPVFSADPPTKAAAPAPGAPTLPKAPAKDVEIESEVDLIQLLKRDLVFPSAVVTDSIWQIDPSEGRFLMRLPLRISKPSATVSAGGANVKIRGARFICWQLIDPKEETGGNFSPLPTTTTINPIGDDALPASVPRMTRSVIMNPAGTISWKMDRAISGAKIIEAAANSPYGFKLNPASVEKLNPGNTPRIVKNAGESAADFIKRKAPLEEEYRKKAATYRELKLQLQKLPDEFTGPTPTTFWAIYETRSNPKTIEFDGAAPLPWEVPFELLLQLQRVYATGAAVETGTPLTGVNFSATSVEENISKALAEPKVHPYTVRLIVNAITLSNYLERLEDGDSKYQVLEKVLATKESGATAELMKYLAVRPSKASASLMKKAITAGLLDGQAQLTVIKGMLETISANSSANPDNAVLTINQYLADPKGAPGKEAIAALMNLALTKPMTLEAIAKTIRFDAPAGARRDELIVAVTEAAAYDALAAAMLDSRILGSEDPALVERALYLISRSVRPTMPLALTDAADKPIALTGAKLVVLNFWSNTPASTAFSSEQVRLHKRYAGQGVAFVGINMDRDKATLELAVKELGYTWPQAWNGQGVDSTMARQWAVTTVPTTIVLSPAGDILWRGHPSRLAAAIETHLNARPAPAPSAADTDPRPRPVADVRISGSEPNIFRLLVDPKLRNLAWAALANMSMPPSDKVTKWPALIVDAAVNQSPTPVSSVHFIAKHVDPGVCDALVQLVTRADSNASKQACRYLLGSGLNIEASLMKLPIEARHAFGMTFYENTVVEAPFAVGLLRDKADNTKVLGWFARQVSLGQLPEPAKWVRPYGTPDRLTEMVLVGDDLLAQGAIGALIASVGGSGGETLTIAGKLRENKNAGPIEIGKSWSSLRKELFATKLRGASGAYTLSLRYGEPVKESKEGDLAWTRPQALGTVQMKVEGPAVSIGKATAAVAADDSLTLTLKGSDLRLLDETPNSPLALIKVGADKVVTLHPQGLGGWFAEVNLDDGSKVEIMLEAKR